MNFKKEQPKKRERTDLIPVNSQTEIQKVSTTEQLWVPERLKQSGATRKTATPKAKNQTYTKQTPSQVCFDRFLGSTEATSFPTAINATAFTLECTSRSCQLLLWRNGRVLIHSSFLRILNSSSSPQRSQKTFLHNGGFRMNLFTVSIQMS